MGKDVPTKPCEQCGEVISKPDTCSKSDWVIRRFCSQTCKVESQRGQAPWNKGLHRDSRAAVIPCRICGNPTRYHGTENHKHYRLLHCDDPACVEKSRQLKNERIAQRAHEMYGNGQRQRVRHSWSTVSRVSTEEQVLTPWFEARGWTPQYRVLTGVHTNKLPRMFRLDFALPERKVYVEIDGSVHRLRKESDARRDTMLSDRGWSGLRLPAYLVRESPDQAKSAILTWLDKQ